jgi:hypothetical protein
MFAGARTAPHLAQLVVGASLLVLAVIGIRALGAQAHAAPAAAHPAAASKGYTAKLSYDETNQGTQRG